MIPQETLNILPISYARRLSGRATEKEKTARATVEAMVGGALPDPDWDRFRARLLEFVSILQGWHRDFPMSGSELLKAA